MIKTVKIAVVHPFASGKSLTTGQTWERQDMVVTWNETSAEGQVRTQYLFGTLRGESLALFRHCGYAEGDELEVDIEFYTNYYNDKVLNKVFFKLHN